MISKTKTSRHSLQYPWAAHQTQFFGTALLGADSPGAIDSESGHPGAGEHGVACLQAGDQAGRDGDCQRQSAEADCKERSQRKRDDTGRQAPVPLNPKSK
ncbi:MAG: hypothetical protein FJ170_01510 [Gammaproteobacteria bacterium]|nr:hypothetical protein [Gammaproteobacteria bacterium]